MKHAKDLEYRMVRQVEHDHSEGEAFDDKHYWVGKSDAPCSVQFVVDAAPDLTEGIVGETVKIVAVEGWDQEGSANIQRCEEKGVQVVSISTPRHAVERTVS